MRRLPELPDGLRSKPGRLAGPCHHFEVGLVKPDPKAKKDCPLCRGRGSYTALHVGEYHDHDLLMSMRCACTNGGKKT